MATHTLEDMLGVIIVGLVRDKNSGDEVSGGSFNKVSRRGLGQRNQKYACVVG